MKSYIIMLLLLVSQMAFGQKYKEWFKQKKTQKKYLIEQIAYLKTYYVLTKKGYKIAQKGLNTISSLKKGEFDLHKNHFDSLLIVKPMLLKHEQVLAISKIESNIKHLIKSQLNKLSQNGFMTSVELKLISQVCYNLMVDNDKILTHLDATLTNKELSLSDSERINRFNLSYREIIENYTFIREYLSQSTLLLRNRRKELGDTALEMNIQGIK